MNAIAFLLISSIFFSLSFRKVFEETGYDISRLAVADEFIEGVLNYQYTRLYLIRNVPIETIFVPRTRKEIKCCEWFSIDHLPTHKTDPVSKNFLGINANSFFMIMPFVKRLKKWINEQQHDECKLPNTLDSASKKYNNNGVNKSAANNKIAGAANGNQTVANSSKTCFFKNNNNATHRQRHKSLGDIDVTVASNSTNNISNEHHLPISDMYSLMPRQKDMAGNNQFNHEPNQRADGNKLSDDISQTNGKRRLFTMANTDESKEPLSMLDMQPNKSTFQPKILTRDNNKKNKTERAIDLEFLPGVNNINGIKKVQKKVSKAENHLVDPIQYRIKNQQRLSPRWVAVFNPPHLSQLLRDEPNILNWRNIKLNKDKIYNESLKILL